MVVANNFSHPRGENSVKRRLMPPPPTPPERNHDVHISTILFGAGMQTSEQLQFNYNNLLYRFLTVAYYLIITVNYFQYHLFTANPHPTQLQYFCEASSVYDNDNHYFLLAFYFLGLTNYTL